VYLFNRYLFKRDFITFYRNPLHYGMALALALSVLALALLTSLAIRRVCDLTTATFFVLNYKHYKNTTFNFSIDVSATPVAFLGMVLVTSVRR